MKMLHPRRVDLAIMAQIAEWSTKNAGEFYDVGGSLSICKGLLNNPCQFVRARDCSRWAAAGGARGILSLPWACGPPMGMKAHCLGLLIPNGLPRDLRRSVTGMLRQLGIYLSTKVSLDHVCEEPVKCC